MATPKVFRMQRKGQITVPLEIREKLGIEVGDLVAFVETADGVFVRPQQASDAKMLAEREALLEEREFSLEDFMNFPQRLIGEPVEQDRQPVSQEEESIVDLCNIHKFI